MFAKYACNRARTVARDARLPAPVTRPRNRLVAAWRWDPLSGRLVLKWQPAADTGDAADLPRRRGPASRPDLPRNRRYTKTAAVTQIAREAAA